MCTIVCQGFFADIDKQRRFFFKWQYGLVLSYVIIQPVGCRAAKDKISLFTKFTLPNMNKFFFLNIIGIIQGECFTDADSGAIKQAKESGRVRE